MRFRIWLAMILAFMGCGHSTHGAGGAAQTGTLTASPSPSGEGVDPSTEPPAPVASPICMPASAACMPLDPTYSPLLAVLVSPGIPAGFFVTIGPFTYVASEQALYDLQFTYTPVQRGAILRHEQEHALAQASMGVAAWCARYQSDAAFRLAQEESGYGKQMAVLLAGGEPGDANFVATFVASLTDPFYGDMINAADAHAWVIAQVMEDPR